jgi:hypothetical protein
MPLTRKQVQYIKENINRNCVHGNNILSKKDKEGIEYFYNEYIKFYKTMEIDNIDDKIISFINYKDYVAKNNRTTDNKLIFSSQSKFESTILEEFLYHIFKNLIEEYDNIFGAGSVKAYNNLYFAPTDIRRFKEYNFININKKDQDFAIYKNVILKDNNKSIELSIPIIAIECKTYLDKTMLEGSVATAEKIKSGNPHCKFYIVTETYEVDLNVDPSTSRIDNIFVLKKSRNNNQDYPICSDVIMNLYNEIKKHLNSNWSNIEENIKNKGIIFDK